MQLKTWIKNILYTIWNLEWPLVFCFLWKLERLKSQGPVVINSKHITWSAYAWPCCTHLSLNYHIHIQNAVNQNTRIRRGVGITECKNTLSFVLWFSLLSSLTRNRRIVVKLTMTVMNIKRAYSLFKTAFISFTNHGLCTWSAAFLCTQNIESRPLWPFTTLST